MRHPEHSAGGPQVALGCLLAVMIVMAVALVTIAFIWADPGTSCHFGGW